MLSAIITSSPLGFLLTAGTEKGVSLVQFGDSEAALKKHYVAHCGPWNGASASHPIHGWHQALLHYLQGKNPWPLLPYDISNATPFQKKVWQRMQMIPSGSTLTYSELAVAVKSPKGARAVARACATNPAALAIPCHRILPKSGGIGGFYWGAERKEKLLNLERK